MLSTKPRIDLSRKSESSGEQTCDFYESINLKLFHGYSMKLPHICSINSKNIFSENSGIKYFPYTIQYNPLSRKGTIKATIK